jgi:polysaccharide chain length determinant protein (PEP-CTERM system associated)
MQKLAEGLKPKEIIEIIIKRRWYIIISFWLSMIAGICLAFTLPKIYSAQTLILVQPQRVPDNYVRSVVSTDIDSRINTISQQILSYSNLEKIIEDFSLYTDPGSENMFMEDKIGGLRESISVDLIRRDRRSGADAFSISFKGKDPEKVMKITNALSSYIIDENLRVREIQAVGTSDFLDEELTSIRNELVAQEKKLKEYREKYMGGLPEQLDSNLRILDRLQLQLSEKQLSIRDAKNRLLMLENQIAQNIGARMTTDGRVVIDSGQSLSPGQAKAQLAYLETRYTEKHPDVIRLKKMISDFETKDEKDAQGTSGESQPVSANLEINTEIKNYMADIPQLVKQIRYHQKLVEDTPRRETELLSLKRDYENIKGTYNSLLDRKLEAKIAVNMEKKQKGEQFRILDPARLPEKPISPDMPKLFLVVLAASFGIGGGLIFLLEYLNTSFRSPEDVESYLGFSVIATVPLIYDQKDKRKQKLNQIFSIVSIMFSFLLFSAFAVLSFNGVDQTMEVVSKFMTT